MYTRGSPDRRLFQLSRTVGRIFFRPVVVLTRQFWHPTLTTRGCLNEANYNNNNNNNDDEDADDDDDDDDGGDGDDDETADGDERAHGDKRSTAIESPEPVPTRA